MKERVFTKICRIVELNIFVRKFKTVRLIVKHILRPRDWR